MSALNNFLFVSLPYMAVIVFLVGTIYRYRSKRYMISSLSSQFLESKKLFWGSIPFHIGMIVIFFGHLIAFLLPQQLLIWNSVPARLLILEGAGLIFALSFLFGLVVLFIRRITNPRIRMVTTPMDIVIELLLLYQIFFGIWIAVNYRWGSSWFASDLSPYLWSIIKFNPQTEAVTALPAIVQMHIIGAFIILLIFPFTRLMHVLVAPFHYLFRPYQQVIWNWNKKTINSSESPWTRHKPKNN